MGTGEYMGMYITTHAVVHKDNTSIISNQCYMTNTPIHHQFNTHALRHTHHYTSSVYTYMTANALMASRQLSKGLAAGAFSTSILLVHKYQISVLA